MGKFAKTAIIDYRLLFTDKRKTIFHCLFAEFRKHGDMDKWTWRRGDMEMETGHGDIDRTWRHRHGDMETWRNADMET